MIRKRAGDILSRLFFLFVICAITASCTTLYPLEKRVETADNIAFASGFEKQRLPTRTFTLLAYERLKIPGKPLVIYIEGDGLAWITPTRLSSDPTPVHPVAFQLASFDLTPNVAYLARPCQYISPANDPCCHSDYWSVKRFSQEVVDATNEAIDLLAKKFETEEIHLVGYSGGGAIAVLIAAKRTDVKSIRTIAGNLDTDAFTKIHHSSPLKGSLNPKDFARDVQKIPQIHYTGSKDKIVPGILAENFQEQLEGKECFKHVMIEEISHNKGWEGIWPEVVSQLPSCE